MKYVSGRDLATSPGCECGGKSNNSCKKVLPVEWRLGAGFDPRDVRIFARNLRPTIDFFCLTFLSHDLFFLLFLLPILLFFAL